MLKKILFATLPIFVCLTTAHAQQPIQYTLHPFTRAAIHSAYAGTENSLVLTGAFRRQWLDLAGSSSTQLINAHLPLAFFNSGLGFTYELDELGAERNTAFRGAYSYHLAVGRTSILSIGVGGGIYQKQLDGALLRTPSGIYNETTIIHNDQLLPNGEVNASAPVLEASVYFKSERLEIGLSSREILEAPIEFTTFNIRPIRSYYFTIATHHDISRSLTLHPSVFVKSDVIQTQIDFSALVDYNDNILIGASFRGYNARTIDAIAAIAGFNISQNLRLVYSYDITLSALRNVNSGSHEIILSYNLNKDIGKGRPPQIIYSPRHND